MGSLSQKRSEMKTVSNMSNLRALPAEFCIIVSLTSNDLKLL